MAVKTLGDVAEYINGRTFRLEEWESEGLPIIRIQNLTNTSRDYHRTTNQYEEKYLVRDGDLLFAWSASLGAHIWRGESGWLNQHIFKVVPHPDICKMYLYYYLLYVVEQLYAKTHGSGMVHITLKPFKATKIPVPPLEVQRCIVARIESLFARLDEARGKLEDVIDGFEARKAAILHKAFAGELTAKWREAHGVKLESWKKQSLGACGRWVGGGTPSMAHSEYWKNGNILWITSKDMKSDLITDTLLHTNILGVENSSANYIEEPALLFVTRSGILRRTLPVAMVRRPFTVNQDLKAVIPDGIDLNYLFFACKNGERDILNTCMKSGTTVESVNTSALMAYEVPIAPDAEQREIVRILEALFDREAQALSAAQAALVQIGLMKKSILFHAFRGELRTKGSSEERAAELGDAILRDK